MERSPRRSLARRASVLTTLLFGFSAGSRRMKNGRRRTFPQRNYSYRVRNLDLSLGFERHYIRGLKKIKLCCSLAFSVMLPMALGRVKEKRPDLMRSLVKSA